MARPTAPQLPLDGMVLPGIVVDFDVAVGLGQVRTDRGELPFHCIEIADGSRTVEVGQPVLVRVGVKLGRFEAFAVTASPATPA